MVSRHLRSTLVDLVLLADVKLISSLASLAGRVTLNPGFCYGLSGLTGRGSALRRVPLEMWHNYII